MRAKQPNPGPAWQIGTIDSVEVKPDSAAKGSRTFDSGPAADRPVATRGGGGVDRISGLPDDILYSILLHLPHTAEAARTSVLSRRWRHVWAHLPAIYLFYDDDVSEKTQDRVDAALDAYTAPTVNYLLIAVEEKKKKPCPPPRVPGHRISAWLRFASQRLTGGLHLAVPVPSLASRHTSDKDDDDEVVLPLSDRADAITLRLRFHMLHLQVPVSGECTALVSLFIAHTRMDSHELENAVSSRRCPCLKVLNLVYVALHGTPPCLTIQSDSLEELCLNLYDEQPECKLMIKVTAPKLQTLTTRFEVSDAHVCAPMLSRVDWFGSEYDPSRHHIAEAAKTYSLCPII